MQYFKWLSNIIFDLVEITELEICEYNRILHSWYNFTSPLSIVIFLLTNRYESSKVRNIQVISLEYSSNNHWSVNHFILSCPYSIFNWWKSNVSIQSAKIFIWYEVIVNSKDYTKTEKQKKKKI